MQQLSNEKKSTDYFKKTLYFQQFFKKPLNTKQQKILTMFNFQHSQKTQHEFEKLANLLLGYPTVYAASKFDIGKINSPLRFSLKPDAVFIKQIASKVPIHLHDKVYLHDYLTF